eukprot:1289210-Alexandrium_andersonii.AAC.1
MQPNPAAARSSSEMGKPIDTRTSDSAKNLAGVSDVSQMRPAPCITQCSGSSRREHTILFSDCPRSHRHP